MRAHGASRSSRTLLVRLEEGDTLPEALLVGLEVESILAGSVRASGVIADVEIRSHDARNHALGETRKIPGRVLAVSIESTIGQVDGKPSIALRAVLSRDSGTSIETFAGEIVRARAIGLDVLVTVFDDVELLHQLDRASGVTLLDAPEVRPAPRPAPLPPRAWASAIEASARTPEPARPTPAIVRTEPMPIPPKPRRAQADIDATFPEAGDLVDHFAFGRGEVLKSDGDRLHLKLARDGRIREIALEMLKVVELEPEAGHRRFKLDRKL
jgi:predicted DNA-binding protein with PD1-like motif